MSKKAIVIVVAAVVAFLVLRGISSSNADAADSSGGCQFTVTANVLNVRSGPSEQATVVGELTGGTKTGAAPTVTNGYRKLDANRWAAQRFLKQVGNGC